MISKAETQINLIVIYTLILFGYVFSLGFYSFGGFLSILIAFFLLFGLKFKKLKDFGQVSLLLSFLLIVSVTLSLIFYRGLYQEIQILVIISQWLLFLMIPLSLLYIREGIKSISFIYRYKFVILMVVAFVLRVLMIISSPHPKIDVFDQLSIGSAGLLEFKNPYQLTFPKVHADQIPVLFGYFPGSVLILSPFKLLFGDHRMIFAMADIGSAFLLFKLLNKRMINDKKNIVAEIVPLIFLYNPISLFVIEQSWLEPLMTFFTFLFVYLLIRNSKSLLPYLVLGLALTIKQTMMIILLPLFFKLRWKFSQLLLTGALAAAIIIPFILWSPQDFFFDLTAGFNDVYNTAGSFDSLTLKTFYMKVFGAELTIFSRSLMLILVTAIVLRKVKTDITGFVYSFLTILLAVNILYEQAYANYYQYINSIILLLLSLSLVRLPDKKNDSQHFLTKITRWSPLFKS